MADSYRIIKAAQGWIGFAASERGLRRVVLPKRSVAAVRRELRETCSDATEDGKLLPKFARQLSGYWDGEQVQFDVPIDTRGFGNFEVDVWNACTKVGYGETTSYKDLAERVARPGAARAVGTAMKHNPCPIVVPCHRVLKSDGSLGGYSGTGGLALKQRLLEMEAAFATA